MPRPRIDTLPRVCFGSEWPFAYGFAWPFPAVGKKSIQKFNAHLSGLPLIAPLPLDSNAEYISCSDRDISQMLNKLQQQEGWIGVLSRLCAECKSPLCLLVALK